ncbi:MAG: hypothetical protein MJ252_14165 [archaeon]|nr:hypothetical protein [archaeon]
MSVKVGVRVRPFNTREKDRESHCIIEMIQNQTIIKDELGQEKKFTFDHSFWSHDGFEEEANGYLRPVDDKYADQAYVFNTVGKGILDNAWEGYHCCLFAYGQTGSGKSYSMVGYGANKGIVPISCEEIFKRIAENTEADKSYEVSFSMLEIYNEKVQDLLVPPNKRPTQGLKIRESKVLGTFVDGLQKFPVTSYEQISKKMDQGYENRTIGSTLMNATSSRAHTIVTIEFRQITKMAGKKCEKVSMINLVDLAGSERAGSTGATGDRLKEGCNINKSLLVLGNVINVLADKATGKKKDVLPPYRDSALTRILRNALGGNSKTVMICALSPASINYEETLSTLRYADRAKKIQNKAVVNESEHDKMVRLLKEENSEMKKMIEELQKKLLGQGGMVGEEDKKAFLELKEQYEANQKEMANMQKSFDEKIEEAKKSEAEHLGERVDMSQPHLVVLNEDPQLSHKLKYGLVNLPVYVGRKHGSPTPQIILAGIGIRQNHAVFEKKGDDIILRPNDKDAGGFIYVNGKRLSDNVAGGMGGVPLKQMDRITFGTNTTLLFLRKSDGKELYEVDWEKAQTELQDELDKFEKMKQEEETRKKEEEMKSLKKDLENQYNKQRMEMEEEFKKKEEEFDAKCKELNQTKERTKLEMETKQREMILKKKIELMEEDKAKKKREKERKQKEDLQKKDNSKKTKEFIHRSEKLENTLINILKKITKMKIIISELRRNINLEVLLQKDMLDYFKDSTNTVNNIMIRVENFEEGTVYYWTTETFYNRYDLMKDLFNKYNDEELDILNLKNVDDPLWDEPKPSVLGYAFYKMEPLIYLMSNESSLSIINPDGIVQGEIDIDLIPHDDKGNEYESVPDQPTELIGQSLNYKVSILRCKNLPEKFCKNLTVEYVHFYNNCTYTTKAYNTENPTTNFEINENFEHTIDYLTREDIEYFKKEKVCFKLLAIEEVEKKGKMPREVPLIEESKRSNEGNGQGNSMPNDYPMMEMNIGNTKDKKENSKKNGGDKGKEQKGKNGGDKGKDKDKDGGCIII